MTHYDSLQRKIRTENYKVNIPYCGTCGKVIVKFRSVTFV